MQPAVEFVARPNELTIRSHLDGRAVSCSVFDAYEAETLRVPANALEDFEGRGQARVSPEATGKDSVLARWDNAGVPHEKTYNLAEVAKASEFPKLPARFTDNDPSILKALHDAMESTARDSARYAVHNVQLRGTGQIVGTDCRQLLVQSGFQFLWTGDVLVPHVTVFGQDFGPPTSISVARTDDHICFRVGAWTIWLPIDKEGRFPKYESIIPQMSAATTHLHISPDDAIYLARTLPNLPGQDDKTPAATLDLNGQVIVRVGTPERRATGVLLVRSSPPTASVLGPPRSPRSRRSMPSPTISGSIWLGI